MDMNNEANFKEGASKLLEKCLFTQEQLADYFSVDRSLISKWKNGSRVMNEEQFKKLCVLMGYVCSDVLNGKKDFEPIAINYRGNMENSSLNKIAEINKIVLNLKYMEDLSNDR